MFVYIYICICKVYYIYVCVSEGKNMWKQVYMYQYIYGNIVGLRLYV